VISVFGLVLSNWEFNLVIIGHLFYALVAGGLVGMERSANGRAAGFRTYALVCISSTMLMVVNAFPAIWYGHQAVTTQPLIDPTRVVQGLMTGIGFLGAGVIFRDGVNVRGLTTAASIWAVAAIGILIGLSFYLAAAMSTILVIGILSVFRRVESRLPKTSYGYFNVRARVPSELTESAIRALMVEHGYTVVGASYKMGDEGRYIEYQLVTSTRTPERCGELAQVLAKTAGVIEFKLSPSRD
jgi:putative Mg2+ transporter-C (MgtC) family protein